MNRNKKYTDLIFDADNTLFDFSRSEAAALEQTFMHFHYTDYNPDIHLPMYREINHSIWKEFEEGGITSGELKTERYRRYFNRIGADGLQPDQFGKTYLHYLSRSFFLINGAEELLKELRDFNLFLLTNGLTDVQRPRFDLSGLKSYFSGIVISEEVGYAKPQPEIFEILFHQLPHHSKNRVLMIGDNLNSDIAGADAFGIDSCWYNPSKNQNVSGITPTYEISKLMELTAIVY